MLSIGAKPADKPIKLAVAGMTHGHISFILGRPDKGDFELVGVFDTNKERTQQMAEKYNLSDESLFITIWNEMLDKTKPDAVVAFGSIYDHLAVVEACAPRGIHVMVEKPLAVNMKHARRMAELAEKNNIFLLTDYETSWYPTTAKSMKMVKRRKLCRKAAKSCHSRWTPGTEGNRMRKSFPGLADRPGFKRRWCNC